MTSTSGVTLMSALSEPFDPPVSIDIGFSGKTLNVERRMLNVQHSAFEIPTRSS
jgi:hypothetical protein